MSLDQESTSEQGPNLNRLPEIPVLEIGSYLNCRDLLNLSHTCRSLFHILEGDSGVWLQALRDEIPKSCDLLKEVALSISKTKNLFSTGNWAKLATLMLKRSEVNWNMPEAAVDVTTYRRIYNKDNPLYVRNYSDFFVILDHTYKETEAGCIIQLKIWDVRSGAAKELTAITVVKNWKHPFISVFNNLVILYSLVQCQVVGWRMNFGKNQLKEVWHRACPNTDYSIDVNEHFFIFSHMEKHLDLPNIKMEVYSTQDASSIFTQNFVRNEGDHLEWRGDNEGWLVILFSRQLFAINFNLKGSCSLKRILAINNMETIDHGTKVKEGKVLHYSSSTRTAQLVDLLTDTCLQEVKYALGEDGVGLEVNFDPKTNKILAYYNDVPALNILFQENNEPVVDFRYSPETDQEIRFLPQRLAMLEWKLFPLNCSNLDELTKVLEAREPNGQYSLRLCKKSGGEEEENYLVKGTFTLIEVRQIYRFLKFQRVSPFLIAFENTGMVVICDSLKINQYLP